MENVQKVVINGRTFEDVVEDINEVASFGFDQGKAGEYRKTEMAMMFEKYKQRADELNKEQEKNAGPKTKYVVK